MNLFSFENPIARFLYLIADLVLLHLLWLLTSIPLFTIGASTTALYYASMKRIRTDEGTICQNFFHSFKENFKQSTILWFFMLLIGGILTMDLRIGLALSHSLGKAILVGTSILLIPYLFTSLYLFPVQAKFENSIRDNVKNAFLMSFSNPLHTLLILVVLATFGLMGFFFHPLLGLMLISGAGILGYLTGGIFVMVFRKYLPHELEEDAEAAGVERLFRD